MRRCEISPAPFSSPGDIFAGKQAFEHKAFNLAGSPHSQVAKYALAQGEQVRVLSGDLHCLETAAALLTLVYCFIKEFRKSHHGSTPPFMIPELRYVDSALAIANTEGTNGRKDVFLVEEMIPGEDTWRKWINNGSAIPLTHKDSDNDVTIQRTTQFLVFAQHVPYIQTGKNVYVSDFQGECGMAVSLTCEVTVRPGAGQLLSDPQIMTAP